ncbi:hypothetical protein Leryth_003326 [Lithospermum erythrorhizon]|uniref:HIT domain-containing protein n=1 Tax=Lithospermum erythrorhizon TaxID=34254 RepID=A0AAV3NPN4_LITER|nr:hypothetical protein Leryth_003326 [Lithospermum erythrorhizon]
MEEQAKRRVSMLFSHICPSNQSVSEPFCSSEVSPSNCLSNEVETNDKDCIFCKIVRGEASALKVYEDDLCLCILDTSPLSHGHSLIIPKCHFPSLKDTPPSIVGAMCSKVPLISEAVMKATDSDSFNLLVNNGESAGQVIFHTHFHIIPRKARDCLWDSESLRRRKLKLDKETLLLAERIRDKLPQFVNFNEDGKSQGSSLIDN